MSTWTEMLSQVRAELEESSASIWTDASLLRWLNDAAQDFARKTVNLEDEQYATSTVGQESYDLPEYTIDVSSVYFSTNEDSLLRLTMKDYTRASQDDDTGDPVMYAIHNNALWLNPVPDTASTIRFFRTYYPTPITLETETVPYADEHEAAMRNYIKARAFEQIGDFVASDRYQMLYNMEAEETAWETKRSRWADEPLQPQMGW